MQVEFKFLPSFSQNEKFTFDQPIYHMHIPKCGGTTIDHIFAKLSKILNILKFERYTYIKNKKFFYNANKENINPFITGHLNYNFAKNLDNVFKFTILRDPKERVISQYKFKVFLEKKTPSEYTFKEYISKEFSQRRDNLITRHLTGLLGEKDNLSSQDKKIAIKNIKYFDSINIMDNWDFFVSDILTKFNLPSILYSRFQQHNYDFTFVPSSQDLDIINKYYEYDNEIYSYVKSLVGKMEINFNNKYNEKICIVSPLMNNHSQIYTKEEIKKLFSNHF